MFNQCLLKLIQFSGTDTRNEKVSAGVRLHRPRFNNNVVDWSSSPQYQPKFGELTVDLVDRVAYTWVGKWDMVEIDGNPGTISVDSAPAVNCFWGYNMRYQGLDFFQAVDASVGGGEGFLKFGEKMIVTARLYHAGLSRDGIVPIEPLTVNVPRPLGTGFLNLNSTMLKKGRLYWELV